MNKRAIIAIDGNQIGIKIEQFILSNNLDDLLDFSKNVTEIIQKISDIVHKHGEIYLSGGDNILATFDYDNLEQLITDIKMVTGSEFEYSIGIGFTAAEAYLALKYAKSHSYYIVEYTNQNFSVIEY